MTISSALPQPNTAHSEQHGDVPAQFGAKNQLLRAASAPLSAFVRAHPREQFVSEAIDMNAIHEFGLDFDTRRVDGGIELTIWSAYYDTPYSGDVTEVTIDWTDEDEHVAQKVRDAFIEAWAAHEPLVERARRIRASLVRLNEQDSWRLLNDVDNHRVFVERTVQMREDGSGVLRTAIRSRSTTVCYKPDDLELEEPRHLGQVPITMDGLPDLTQAPLSPAFAEEIRAWGWGRVGQLTYVTYPECL